MKRDGEERRLLKGKHNKQNLQKQDKQRSTTYTRKAGKGECRQEARFTHPHRRRTQDTCFTWRINKTLKNDLPLPVSYTLWLRAQPQKGPAWSKKEEEDPGQLSRSQNQEPTEGRMLWPGLSPINPKSTETLQTHLPMETCLMIPLKAAQFWNKRTSKLWIKSSTCFLCFSTGSWNFLTVVWLIKHDIYFLI